MEKRCKKIKDEICQCNLSEEVLHFLMENFDIDAFITRRNLGIGG